MADKCKNCKHYKKIDENVGKCRRYPPIARWDKSDKPTHFPVVEKDDLCGEFVEET